MPQKLTKSDKTGFREARWTRKRLRKPGGGTFQEIEKCVLPPSNSKLLDETLLVMSS